MTKTGSWMQASSADFFTHLYTVDRDQRIVQFFQLASVATVRIDHLQAESAYSLCAYLINSFGVVSDLTCLDLYTMSWGEAIKARLSFSQLLTAQELNNVICYFTSAASTHQMYLVDSEGNSCGNRTTSNSYYRYIGSSFITETQGTNIYLFTNPTLTGSDPAPLAFTSLFSGNTELSSAALSGAQSSFSITYMAANYVTSFNARAMTSSTTPSSLSVHYNTPSYNSVSKQLTVSEVQLVGGEGAVYFILVQYKTIQINNITGSTTVSIRMNNDPSAEQVLNC